MIQILDPTKDLHGSEPVSELLDDGTDSQNPSSPAALGGGTGLSKFDDDLDDKNIDGDMGHDHFVQNPNPKGEIANTPASGVGPDTTEETDSNVYPMKRDDETSETAEMSDGEIAQTEKSQA